MSKPIVLIAESLSPATIEALGPDFDVRECDGADRGELLAAIVDADALLVRSATKVDSEALAAATRLKVVARAGVGLDNVARPSLRASEDVLWNGDRGIHRVSRSEAIRVFHILECSF